MRTARGVYQYARETCMSRGTKGLRKGGGRGNLFSTVGDGPTPVQRVSEGNLEWLERFLGHPLTILDPSIPVSCLLASIKSVNDGTPWLTDFSWKYLTRITSERDIGNVQQTFELLRTVQ